MRALCHRGSWLCFPGRTQSWRSGMEIVMNDLHDISSPSLVILRSTRIAAATSSTTSRRKKLMGLFYKLIVSLRSLAVTRIMMTMESGFSIFLPGWLQNTNSREHACVRLVSLKIPTVAAVHQFARARACTLGFFEYPDGVVFRPASPSPTLRAPFAIVDPPQAAPSVFCLGRR